jgi:hypothetical protein
MISGSTPATTKLSVPIAKLPRARTNSRRSIGVLAPPSDHLTIASDSRLIGRIRPAGPSNASRTEGHPRDHRRFQRHGIGDVGGLLEGRPMLLDDSESVIGLQPLIFSHDIVRSGEDAIFMVGRHLAQMLSEVRNIQKEPYAVPPAEPVAPATMVGLIISPTPPAFTYPGSACPVARADRRESPRTARSRRSRAAAYPAPPWRARPSRRS